MSRTPSRLVVLRVVWLILPFLVCLAVMLPRLQSAQFGLFDDGVTIVNARSIVQGGWSPGWEANTGRFRPAYWLYYALIYALAGPDPLAFFAGNALIFLASTGAVILLARQRGAGWFTAGLAGLLFSLAGPTIENYYTLSKGEPLQLLGVLVALLLAYAFDRAPRRWLKALVFLGAALAMFGAAAVKETTLAMVGLYAGWLALAWLYRRIDRQPRSLWPYAVGLVASVLAGGAFLALRGLYVTAGLTESGGYTGGYLLTAGNLAASTLRWLGWLLRDFNYLLPLLPLALGWGVWCGRRLPPLEDLELLAWMAVWMAVFLPWTYTVEYYMLPFAAGCVLFASHLVEQVAAGPLQASRGWRWLAGGGLLVSGLLVLLTLLNQVSNGRVQLAMDLSNARLISYLAESVPAGGEVVINMPADLEFVYEVRLHLNHLYGRPDIQTDRFFFQGPQPGEPLERSFTLITPMIENTPRHAVRVGVYPQGAREWLRALQDFLGGSPQPEWQDHLEFRLAVIDLPRLFCPLLGERNFCAQPGQVLSLETFAYGWQVYPLTQDASELSQPGSYNEGTWTLRLLDGSQVVRIFGSPGDLPIPADYNGDGLADLAVYRPGAHSWLVDLDQDEMADLEFSLPGMGAGDLPLAGDWDGDGVDAPAFYRPADGSWSFFNSLQPLVPDLVVPGDGFTEQPQAQPLVGDWDGDGRDTFGLYQPGTGALDLENNLQSGLGGTDRSLSSGTVLVPGRWGARPGDTLAVWLAGEWTPLMVLCDCQPSNPPKSFSFGDPKGIPVQGIWREP